MIYCDNTDHNENVLIEDPKEVVLTKDFGGDTCVWCKNCRERDASMIDNDAFMTEEEMTQFVELLEKFINTQGLDRIGMVNKAVELLDLINE